MNHVQRGILERKCRTCVHLGYRNISIKVGETVFFLPVYKENNPFCWDCIRLKGAKYEQRV